MKWTGELNRLRHQFEQSVWVDDYEDEEQFVKYQVEYEGEDESFQLSWLPSLSIYVEAVDWLW